MLKYLLAVLLCLTCTIGYGQVTGNDCSCVVCQCVDCPANVSAISVVTGKGLTPVSTRQPVATAVRTTAKAVTRTAQAVRNRLIVNRDAATYADCLREAQIIASRGENYYRYRDGGHPVPSPPGIKSGTGYSRDPNRANHCWLGELPESRLIARAMVPGPNGTYFWAARYR